MSKYSAIAALAFAAVSASAMISAPASAAPVCESGFQTVQKESWILKCRKTAPMAYKGMLLTQAYNANCTPNAYWNFGPKVTAKHLRRNTLVQVEYTCGHVEG